MVPSLRCGWGDFEAPLGLLPPYPPPNYFRTAWVAETPSMPQLSRWRASPNPGAVVSAGPLPPVGAPELGDVPATEAVRVVVEPATQSGRAEHCSVGYEQTERREEWEADRAQEGVDVLTYHPRLMQTGLDLIDFRYSFGLRPSSLSSNQQKTVRFSWAVELDAMGAEQVATGC